MLFLGNISTSNSRVSDCIQKKKKKVAIDKKITAGESSCWSGPYSITMVFLCCLMACECYTLEHSKSPQGGKVVPGGELLSQRGSCTLPTQLFFPPKNSPSFRQSDVAIKFR